MKLTSHEQLWQSEGYRLWPMKEGSFIPGFARVWFLTIGDTHHFRVEIAECHLNGFDKLHGGFLSTMADVWLGYNVALRMPRDARIVTSSLTIDFLRAVTGGACLRSAIDRVRIGRRNCFASGAIYLDEEPVATMRATFSVLDGGSGEPLSGN